MTSNGVVRSPAAGLRDARGVTLLELLVALSLFALVIGSIFAFVGTAGRSARVANDFLQAQPQVRAALDTAVDEIRWAQSVTCASATSVTLLIPQNTPFSAASSYLVTFAYDAAADTVTRRENATGAGCPPGGTGEPIAFSVVRPDGTDGLIFEYFDSAGTSLGSTPPDVTIIARVRMIVTTTRNQVSRTFAGDAALRAR
ncbi:MAG: prepilin-type N-terminal cleavage/methylation domain-containing protein [bacterium]